MVDRDSKNPDVSERWYQYLKIAWIREPIGQRYLRKILTTFKFELNLLVATVPTMLGTLALHHYHLIRDEDTAWLAVSIALLGCYLWYAVRADADLLHRLRGAASRGRGGTGGRGRRSDCKSPAPSEQPIRVNRQVKDVGPSRLA